MFIAMPPHDHCVYQLLDRDAQVIYVGSSSWVFARLGQHAKSKDWWSQVCGISVESFATKMEMLNRERALIEMINPIYNDTYGTADALAMGSDLLGRKITREDVRAYVRGEIQKIPLAREDAQVSDDLPQGISLRRYAQEKGLELRTLQRWKERRTDFPVEVGEGAGRAKLYDRDHLDAFVAGRLREPATADEAP